MEDSPLPSRTLRSYYKHLEAGWELDDWLAWPPDAFALASSLLSASGAYRFAITPPDGESWPCEIPGRWHPHEVEAKRWTRHVDDVGDEWAKCIGEAEHGEPKLPKTIACLLANLKAVENRPIGRLEDDWEVCKLLLELHAIADAACGGLGIPSPPPDGATARFRVAGSVLLAMRGSLSRLHPRHGLVVPKMRTPQVGATIRALSHHVSFVRSEVAVDWRTVPWLNQDEDNVNILIVPWPYRIDATAFVPVHHPGNRERLGKVRYFDFQPETPPGVDVATHVVHLLEAAKQHAQRTHVVVLPEMALEEREWEGLLEYLAAREGPKPIVIAGVRNNATTNHECKNGSNTVRLAAYFAGSWYKLEQHKHHRWKLDSGQIDQYDLAGALTAEKDWWELIDVKQRTLNFLCANGWLTLCPLICEDLARLDPVSEVIRAVGPTLVVALLLDGPQLRPRWSARYANILSEDPGSSVLTVTSLGMALRSAGGRHGPNPTIALWKDSHAGAEEIRLDVAADQIDPRVRAHGVLLTVAARWREEATLDDRLDGGAAASLRFHQFRELCVELPDNGPDRPIESRRQQILARRSKDVRELTRFVHLVSALLEAPDLHSNDHFEELRKLVERPGMGADRGALLMPLRHEELWRSDDDPPEASLIEAMKHLRALIDSAPAGDAAVDVAKLVDLARPREDRSDTEDDRHWELAREAVLWAVYNQLASDRRHGRLTLDQSKLAITIEELWNGAK